MVKAILMAKCIIYDNDMFHDNGTHLVTYLMHSHILTLWTMLKMNSEDSEDAQNCTQRVKYLQNSMCMHTRETNSETFLASVKWTVIITNTFGLQLIKWVQGYV